MPFSGSVFSVSTMLLIIRFLGMRFRLFKIFICDQAPFCSLVYFMFVGAFGLLVILR